MALGCKGNLSASRAAASGCAMVPPPPPPGPAPRRDSNTSLASTRANSPCGSSSAASSFEDAAGRCTTTGSASPSKRWMSSTASSSEEVGNFALRRGIRSAILSDLGIGQVAPIPQSPVGTPLSYPPPSMPALVPPPLPPLLALRRPCLMLAEVEAAVESHSVPPCPVGPPPAARPINSTPVTSFQHVSPSGGDASQRGSGIASCTPVASCSRAPHGDLLSPSLGSTTPGNADSPQRRSLTLTATAAPAPSPSMLLSPQSKSGDASRRTPLQGSLAALPAAEAAVVSGSTCVTEPLGTSTGSASPNARHQGDASQRSPTNGVCMDLAANFLNTGALQCWLAGTEKAATMSAAELADKLAAAAPDIYED
mmetsp:Transcript_23320/g.58894  ORF Transcript_23320/g.58894 Transcript_23320/m.58894 type:complete len:368 (-) Transcript_23320:333-1436(-)